MYIILLVIFLLVCISLIGIIMLQQGKGDDMRSSFSSGASITLFGSSGSSNFMTRITAIFATLFFMISLVLGNLNSNKSINSKKWERVHVPTAAEHLPGEPTAPISSINEIPH